MAVYDFIMGDGTREKITLNMGALADLSRTQRPLYDEYNRIRRMKAEDVDDMTMARLLYIAYRAANVHEEDPMEEDAFFREMPDSREAWSDAINMLMGTREKKPDSAPPFKKRHGKGRIT